MGEVLGSGGKWESFCIPHGVIPGICKTWATWHKIFKSYMSQVALVAKNLPAKAGDGDVGLILRSGRSPGGGNGSPLQCSCLANPTDRGAWQATVHRVTKSQTRLKRLSTYSSMKDIMSPCLPSWGASAFMCMETCGSGVTVCKRHPLSPPLHPQPRSPSWPLAWSRKGSLQAKPESTLLMCVCPRQWMAKWNTVDTHSGALSASSPRRMQRV